MTSALINLYHGNLRASFADHPFAIGMVMYFGLLQAVGISEILQRIEPGGADRIIRGSGQLLSVGLLATWVVTLAEYRGENEWHR